MLRNSSLFPSFVLSPLQPPTYNSFSPKSKPGSPLKMMCSEEPLHFPLPAFENPITSNELDELLSFFQSSANNNINNASVDEELSPQPLSSNSGSDDQPTGFGEEIDEKKKRRKMSNRESARRSRWRKKRHLEDLTAQVTRLKAQNRENTNRLSLVLNRLRAVKMQNELMRFECVHLIQRHAGLNRVLQAVQYNDKIINNNNNNNYDRFADGNGLFSSLQRV